jgi:acyl transferase domain-containing protein
VPWLLAAEDAAGLAARAAELRNLVMASDGVDLAGAGWSLASAQPPAGQRAAIVAGDREDLLASLTAVQGGRGRAGVVTGTPGTAGQVAFVFTGQGAQRRGMGQRLHEAYPAFADAFDAVCAELDARLHLGQPLADVIGTGREAVAGTGREAVAGTGRKEAGKPGGGGPAADLLDETVWTQAALFAVEVALFRLLESWGVRPDAVAGHSIGELAAAYVAGVWSLPGACTMVAARGSLMQALPRGGMMVAVEAGEDEVRRVLAGFPGAVVAAVNGPRAVVISGAEPAVAGAAGEFAASGTRTRRLCVSHAFHSPLMDPMLAEFAEVTRSVAYHRPGIPLVSALTGTLVTTEAADPAYWVRHVRETVRFADAVAALRAAGVRTFLEVGPDGVLSSIRTQGRAIGVGSGQPAEETWLPASRRGRDEARTVVLAVAGLHVRGGKVDWDSFYAGTGADAPARPLLPGTPA